MNFKEDYITMIYINVFDDKKVYSMGLSRKKQDGEYEYGYIQARFRSGVDFKTKTKIKVKESWLSFNVNEKKTFPFVFVNDFEVVSEAKPKEENPYEEMGNSIRTEVQQQLDIDDSDLPF